MCSCICLFLRLLVYVCVCVFVCLLVCVFVCLAVCNVLFASVLVCLSVVFVCVCVFELVFVFTPCVGDPVRMCAHVACMRYAFARFVFVLGLCLCQRVCLCLYNCLLFWCWQVGWRESAWFFMLVCLFVCLLACLLGPAGLWACLFVD